MLSVEILDKRIGEYSTKYMFATITLTIMMHNHCVQSDNPDVVHVLEPNTETGDLRVPRRLLCSTSSLCVGGFICVVCNRTACFSSLLLLVPWKAVLRNCGIYWISSPLLLQ